MFYCCIALLITTRCSITDTLWTETGEGYSISVNYPEIALEYETIGNRLEEFASEQNKQFFG